MKKTKDNHDYSILEWHVFAVAHNRAVNLLCKPRYRARGWTGVQIGSAGTLRG